MIPSETFEEDIHKTYNRTRAEQILDALTKIARRGKHRDYDWGNFANPN